MFDRLNRALQQHLDPDKTAPQLRQPTIDDLLPGDVVSFWDYGRPRRAGGARVSRRAERPRNASGAGTSWTKDESSRSRPRPTPCTSAPRPAPDLGRVRDAHRRSRAGRRAQSLRSTRPPGHRGAQPDALRIRRQRLSRRLDGHLRRRQHRARAAIPTSTSGATSIRTIPARTCTSSWSQPTTCPKATAGVRSWASGPRISRCCSVARSRRGDVQTIYPRSEEAQNR